MDSQVSELRLMIFDVDGVLTDGQIYYDANQESLKAFSTLDGLGLQLLRQSGVELAVITGRVSAPLERRLDDLGIKIRYTGIDDKATAYRELLQTTGLCAHQTGFMGDDLVDLPVMLSCGFSATTPDAPLLVQQYAHFIATRHGGEGAVREVCEWIMKQQGTWETQVAHYLIPAIE